VGGRSTLLFAAFAASSLGAISLAMAAGGGGSPAERAAPRSEARPAIANRCVALGAGGEFVTVRGESGYSADAANARDADPFHLKPTGTGTFLVRGANAALMAALEPGGAVGHSHLPGPATEWAIRGNARRGFSFAAATSGERIAVDPSTRELTLAADGTRFDLVARKRCNRYPEARVGARGRPGLSVDRRGRVVGIADAHMHVTANLRAGGRVIHGQSFHPYGIPEALGHDEDDHGPEGSLDLIGNLLRTGEPVGTHDTHGWPTFAGWPVHDTYTHQQAYDVWIERMWRAGLRVLNAQAVEDEALCELAPMRSHSCDETETVKLAIAELRRLEDYVDAQAGGPGRGWFRIVEGPREARRVAARGKLAVLIGMETSSPFGCSEFQGEPQCTREDVDRVLGELHDLGVRSVFIAHWIDNAFSGVALQSGAQGEFIGIFQQETTGHPFATQPCGEADEADGTCNSKGLTELGRYLIERMMRMGMLIEADHLSQVARAEVLELARENDYPLVSSHTGTGGEWTPAQLDALYASGGVAAATPEEAPLMAQKVNTLRAESGGGRRAGVALGSDTGGFSALPGPRANAAERPLDYPFRSRDGAVRFKRQRTGERTYDLNADGVAHYGLFPDLLADMEGQRGGERALDTLFRSAEHYLRMWEWADD
jgi:microsomal dipeptidase-like Zn-dependent dipeptidase